MNINDPKVGRRLLMLGEDKARMLSVAEIGASHETETLINLIDKLVDRLYVVGGPAKLRVYDK